ncbi:hypothetical protein [Yoonia maritima]|uniref:hypothetical protein n=1 Tax=Yoonia maritima TaxID=1435347 RepID=UPI000D10B90A|nr:hypothetical protein [Yoonia maritima]
MKFAFAVLTLLPVAAYADIEYWDYNDWRVIIETVDTGEDTRVFCTALTGGDGMPSLRIDVSNGDALPPAYYPAPTLYETAPRGYETLMKDGQRVLFEFDPDNITEGFVTAGFDDDGIRFAYAQAHQDDSLWLLQSMRQAAQLWITLDGEVVYGASLAGFTASYGKIAEQCGFSTVGVIN